MKLCPKGSDDAQDCSPGRVYDWHNGIDYAYGETYAEFVDFEVIAGATGHVEAIGPSTSSGGGSVRIKHFDGRMSDYAHLGEIYVKNGQEVHRSMLLGRIFINWDEPHLHFELMGLQNEGRLQWNYWRVDIYRDPLDDNSLSYWTKDNDPQFTK